MALEAKIAPYLSLVDALRSHGLDADIQLPQIAVVGDQSSGKSSVLEALSGFPYPRGVGMTTKCPTTVAMRRADAGTPWRAELRVLETARATTTQAEVFSEPQELTRRLAELNQEIGLEHATHPSSSNCRITVRVFAPNVPDLTLVDLPGIVRTTTAGQRQAMIKEVDEMIHEYIRLERTIILAVIPANQDIATVDVLERANNVDPGGKRTIGVLTKVDLVSPGGEEEVMAIVNNVKKPLRLGYVIVKNRNQLQLEQGTSFEDAKRDEIEFFRGHSVFSHLERRLFGVDTLSERLTEVLVARIKSSLPSMLQELKQQLKETDILLEQVGEGAPTEAFHQRTQLLQLLSRFCSQLREISRGEYRDALLSAHPELRLRTAIDSIKKKLQVELIALRPQFDTEEFRTELRIQLQSLRGREPPGFTNTQFFITFMTLDMENWRHLIETSVWNTVQAFKHACALLIGMVAPQYPQIAGKVMEITATTADSMHDGALARIEEYLTRHTETLATYDDLLQSINTVRFNAFERTLSEAMANAGDRAPAGGKGVISMKEAVKSHLGAWYMSTHGVTSEYQVDDVRAVLKAYWAVCAKRVHEEVCMVLDSLLVGKTIDQLDQELMEFAHIHSQRDPTSLTDLFAEPVDVVERRRTLRAKQSRLHAALEEIRRITPGNIQPLQQYPSQPAQQQEYYTDPYLSTRSISATRAISDVSLSSVDAPSPFEPHYTDLSEVKLDENVSTPSSLGSSKFLQPHDAPKAAADMMAHDQPADSRPISEPEGLARELTDGCVAVFNYVKNGDNRGYVFWLGTTGYVRPFENPQASGRIRVTSSGMTQGDETLIFSRQKARAWTRSCTDSFIAVDIGRNRYLLLTHLTILHGRPEHGHDMTNYAIEGLDPSTSNRWVSLTDGPPPAVPSGRVTTVPLSTRVGFHRRFRLRCTGPQQDGSLSLFVAGLELYGRLYSQLPPSEG